MTKSKYGRLPRHQACLKGLGLRKINQTVEVLNTAEKQRYDKKNIVYAKSRGSVMYLNTIQASVGSRKKAKRVGRGIGCTLGKTCGRGHKGQKARSGGFHKVGFEGGQMPLQRRLPKIGFTSQMSKFSAEVRLSELNVLVADEIDLKVLIDANIVPAFTKIAKVIQSGVISKAVSVKGIKVTAGARESIEAVGGKVEA